MIEWKKTGRVEIMANDESTIFYESQDGRWKIESRKRAIPHANGIGCWMHTTYVVIDEYGMEHEKRSLRDAKEEAERLAAKYEKA